MPATTINRDCNRVSVAAGLDMIWTMDLIWQPTESCYASCDCEPRLNNDQAYILFLSVVHE